MEITKELELTAPFISEDTFEAIRKKLIQIKMHQLGEDEPLAARNMNLLAISELRDEMKISFEEAYYLQSNMDFFNNF
jgi:hypothetical protein